MTASEVNASSKDYRNEVCETVYGPLGISASGCVSFYDSFMELVALPSLGGIAETSETQFFAACLQYNMVQQYGVFPQQDACGGYAGNTLDLCPAGLGGECKLETKCSANMLQSLCNLAVDEA